MPIYRGKYWCFTINNWTPNEQTHLESLFANGEVEYLVWGREVSPHTGTPHLQGYTILKSDVRLSRVKAIINERGHFERARGTPEENRNYCIKSEDFSEYGECPTTTRGRRSDWERFREWVGNHPPGPITNRELFLEFPGLFARHRERIHEFVGLIRDPVDLVGDEHPRAGWQADLWEDLNQNADDRTVHIYVDPEGASGKSWFTRYAITKLPELVQVLSVSKRDDLQFAIDPNKSVFLFDVPRGQMEFFRWEVVEALKNRVIFSSKYQSQTKFLAQTPHVVIFCNELDMDFLSSPRGLTYDRWSDSIVNLS